MIMKRIAVICFCLYVLYFLTFMISVKREKSDAFPGVPEELSKKENYLCEISDFCVNDGLIYLLFDDKGVIQIFDEKGIYQKSFAFYAAQNGKSGLRIMGDDVLLFDKRKNCYKFVRGDFCEYLELDNDQYLRLVGQCEERHQQIASEKGNYYLKGASLFRKNADVTDEIIIKRPMLATLFQGNLRLWIEAVLMIFAVFFIMISKKFVK